MSFAEIRGSGFGSVIAENNSTKFYIKPVGVHSDMTVNAGVYVNDVLKTRTNNDGLTVYEFDIEMNLLKQQTFNFDESLTSEVTRFKDYMTAITGAVVVMTTFNKISNNADLSAYMAQIGSSTWPSWLTASMTDAKKFAYCCIYDPKTKNIVAEAVGSRGSNYPATIDYYFDSSIDLGTLGAGRSLVEQATEYSGSAYTVKNYVVKQSLTNFPHITSGEWLNIRCDMKRDQAAITAGVQCRMIVQFYSKGSYLTAMGPIKTPGLEWTTEEVIQQIPEGADEVEISFYHAPATLDGQGLAFVKNVIVQPTNASVKKNKTARLGRFSAPTDSFKEGPIVNQPNTVLKFTNDDLLEASELQELDSGYWVKLLDHNTLNKGMMFANFEQALSHVNYDESYLFSIMDKLEDFRMQNGKFRFKIEYNILGSIEWTQSSSPEESTVKDLNIIKNTVGGTQAFLGIRRCTTGARYSCSTDDTWYYALGAIELWSGGIPANGEAVQQVRFYAWKE